MPELDGIEAAKIIKSKWPEIKIIMLTQYCERSFRKQCMKINVEGYLLKGNSGTLIAKTIREIHNGGVFYQTNGNKSYSRNAENFLLAKYDLSGKEIEVLLLMANEFCSREIAEKMNISENTVRSYKERLFRKSGTKTSVGLIMWAMEKDFL
jgi:DNA-binding NarL/FixJ family response regulator